MKTPYIPHLFGDAVEAKLREGLSWVTAGVASSIPWPIKDVVIKYAGDEFFLRGTELNGKASPPGISIRHDGGSIDDALTKIYRLTSVLSWFFGGYVDIAGHVSGSRPFLYGDRLQVHSQVGVAGEKSFNCNHMPIIEHEHVRIALAFWREGMRLKRVHDSYSFLSFFKVIESQFKDGGARAAWIVSAIDKLGGDAQKRVLELRAQKTDPATQIWGGGRCAVAHASLDKGIVDPDLPQDRRRLSADLELMQALARQFIQDELKVPDQMSLYRTRNRLAPWKTLVGGKTFTELAEGSDQADLSGLEGRLVSVGLWPDGPIPGLENMTMRVDAKQGSLIKVVLFNPRMTIYLVFVLDFKNGKIHTNLEEGGLAGGDSTPDENDVRAYATFFYRVITNKVVELICDEVEPVDCEIVIPVNIIPPNPETAIEEAVIRFRNASKK